jgi:hypothetical protein
MLVGTSFELLVSKTVSFFSSTVIAGIASPFYNAWLNKNIADHLLGKAALGRSNSVT